MYIIKGINVIMDGTYLSVSDLVDRAFKFLFKLIKLFKWYRAHVLTSIPSHAQLKTTGFFPQHSQFIVQMFLLINYV